MLRSLAESFLAAEDSGDATARARAVEALRAALREPEPVTWQDATLAEAGASLAAIQDPRRHAAHLVPRFRGLAARLRHFAPVPDSALDSTST